MMRLTLVTYLFQIFGGVNVAKGIHGRVKRFNFGWCYLPDLDLLKKISDFVIFCPNELFDMIYASSGIKGMDRMVSILKGGDYDVIVFPQTYHVVDNCGIEEGHVTGCNEARRMGSIKQAGIDTNQGTPFGEKIYCNFKVKIRVIQGIVRYQDNLFEQLAEEFRGPFDNCSLANLQKGLVYSHADIFSTGKNYSCNRVLCDWGIFVHNVTCALFCVENLLNYTIQNEF